MRNLFSKHLSESFFYHLVPQIGHETSADYIKLSRKLMTENIIDDFFGF